MSAHDFLGPHPQVCQNCQAYRWGGVVWKGPYDGKDLIQKLPDGREYTIGDDCELEIVRGVLEE